MDPQDTGDILKAVVVLKAVNVILILIPIWEFVVGLASRMVDTSPSSISLGSGV